MVQEAYVSFEIAKLLKEKGYCQISNNLYNEKGEFVNYDVGLSNKSYSSDFKEIYEAPTQALVMRWLREVHCILFSFHLCLGEKAANEGLYQIGVYEQTATDTYTWRNWIIGDTYEETYDKAIRYSLESLCHFDNEEEE